jgi:hypothetical protein
METEDELLDEDDEDEVEEDSAAGGSGSSTSCCVTVVGFLIRISRLLTILFLYFTPLAVLLTSADVEHGKRCAHRLTCKLSCLHDRYTHLL